MSKQATTETTKLSSLIDGIATSETPMEDRSEAFRVLYEMVRDGACGVGVRQASEQLDYLLGDHMLGYYMDDDEF